ncbi:MAG: 3-oxoacyl-ACP synthase [Treponema sp.]|jgi:3-oxoacyl-[acyl-carrier-protein] synthase-1|nr:3-oxoacyl-ACP synthase [Treponema sp.]
MRLYLSRPGLVSCAGNSLDDLFNACTDPQSKSGIQVYKTENAAVKKQFLAGRCRLPLTHTTRVFSLCAAALEQIRPAVERALGRWGAPRVGVCVGSCDNGTEWSVPAHRAFFAGGGFPSGYELDFQSAAPPADFTAGFFGAGGPALAVSTACASSASALARAADLVQSGVCGAVIAGGVDIVSDTVLLGFSALEAVSGEITNPFSKNRKGITLGEGAAFFVVSKEPLDGGMVLSGYGESADAFHMTAPDPSGKGAEAAMRSALESAGIAGGGISYVNLHGTGTPLNDSAEASAMAAVFGECGAPASSTKPVTGHTLGAAGALELAICYAVLAQTKNPALPLHRWDGVPDPALKKTALVDKALSPSTEIRYCMSNSFAFGGCNVSLIISRDHGYN